MILGNNAGLVSIIDIAFGILQLLILARILMSWFPVSPWNPWARRLRAIVDPILSPFRRLLPSFGGLDFSPLLALATLYVVEQVVNSLLLSGTFSPGGAVLAIVREVTLNIIVIICVVLFIRLVFSFFHADPWHPLVMMVRRFTDSIVRPFASLAPRAAGIDVGAAAAFLVFLVLYFVGRVFFNAVGAP